MQNIPNASAELTTNMPNSLKESTINRNLTNISLNSFANDIFGKLLHDPNITEIAINKPKEICFESKGIWSKEENEHISFKKLMFFATSLASFNNSTIDDCNPILSGTLETKERVQVVIPPAVAKNTISVTLRKPSDYIFSHQSYIDNKFYDKISHRRDSISNSHDELKQLYLKGDIPRFLESAVRLGKTIIFAGATGSGKTSFMKTLIEYIPLESRLVTIEDTAEIQFLKHKNYVHLFFPSESAFEKNAVVTPSSLLKACFRMKPDRILLSEVRGSETWDFLKSIASGHGGGMTSIHAGSCKEALQGLITRAMQNPETTNLSYQMLSQIVSNSIDIVCHVSSSQGRRYLNEIYFKGISDEII